MCVYIYIYIYLYIYKVYNVRLHYIISYYIHYTLPPPTASDSRAQLLRDLMLWGFYVYVDVYIYIHMNSTCIYIYIYI